MTIRVVLGLRAPTRRLGVGASMSVERGCGPVSRHRPAGSRAPRGDGRRVRRRRLPRRESRENESWPGAADSCAPHRSIWRGCGPATVEEKSRLPPSPRVVKGFERMAVVTAIKGSRIARSRPTAARCAGGAKRSALSARLATAQSVPTAHRSGTQSRGLRRATSRKPRLVGSAEAETAWRERPHLWPRANRRLGQISWSLTPRYSSRAVVFKRWRCQAGGKERRRAVGVQ